MLAKLADLFSDLVEGGATRFLCVGCSSSIILLRLMTLVCLMPELATVMAVSFVALPVAALRPYSCEGFISKFFLFLLLLSLLTSYTPVF